MKVDQAADWMEQTGNSARALALLPESVRAQLPALYASEDAQDDDPLVRVKLFTPLGNWTWYVLEGSISPATERYTLFALVEGFDVELGYADLEELASLRGPFGLPMVERDLYWKPAPLSEVQRQIGDA